MGEAICPTMAGLQDATSSSGTLFQSARAGQPDTTSTAPPAPPGPVEGRNPHVVHSARPAAGQLSESLDSATSNLLGVSPPELESNAPTLNLYHVSSRFAVRPLRRGWIRVVLSVFAVLILMVSSAGAVRANSPSALTGASLSGSGSGAPPPYYPYLTNSSAWPLPTALQNLSGNLSLPQVATVDIGSTFVFVLAFVTVVPSEGTILEFDTGSYAPASALALAEAGGCTGAGCGEHLPINWNPPTPIAAYGGSPIQSDAMAVTPSGEIVVAAASNSTTRVYESQSLGAAATWFALSGESAIPGGTPEVAVTQDGCDVVVTTHPEGKTQESLYSSACTLVNLGQPSGQLADRRALLLPAGSSSPLVYGVVASQGPAGSTVNVYGVGFGTVQSVRFGTVAAPFKVISSTQVQAMAPGGSGTTTVQVEAGSVWSPTNCSTEFTYGAPLAPGTPQVSWITPSLAQTGTSVTLSGFNFQQRDSVFFGSVRAWGVAWLSPNTLRVVVPASSGVPNVNVTVRYNALASPTTCADLFHYPGPQLTSISPAKGWNPLTVVLKGANFSSSASVYFGSTASTSVTWVSSTELKAVLPAGTGANSVPVTVRQASYTSQSIMFTYAPPTPVVSAIIPDQGPAGSGVTVLGQNLASSAVVYFGSQASSSTQYTSSTMLVAQAPAGSGTVSVTVHQFGEASATVCSAEFTYGAALPAGSPYVAELSSPEGIGGSWIILTGVNFTPSADEVFFGGVPSPAVNVTGSTTTALDVEVPLGQGNVSVQVVSSQGSSPPGCGSRFDIVSPGPAPGSMLNVNLALPESTSAVPVYTGSLAGSPFMQSGWVVTSAGATLSVYPVGSTTVVSSGHGPLLEGSLGGSTFSQIGDTGLTLPGGTPLQVAAAPDGAGIFVLATTDQMGRTILESLVWNSTAWGEPYFTQPTVGSAADPQVVRTPFGQYYASWVDFGAGPSVVDLAVFGSAGQLVRIPNEIAGLGGSTGSSVSTASLGVDPMGHPELAWSWGSGPLAGSLGVWADYESPASLMSGLATAWNQLSPADFEDFGASGLASFESRVQGALQSASTDIAQADWCGADQNVSNQVYTNITWQDRSPVLWGVPPTTGCDVYVGVGHNTLVTPNTGLFAANFYLSVQTEWLMEALGVGVMPIPQWNQFMTVNTTNPQWFQPDSAASAMDASGQVVAVDPETTGTNTLILVPQFAGQSKEQQGPAWGLGGCYSSTVTDSPSGYINAPTIDYAGSTHGGTFTGSSFIPIPAFTDILPDRNGTYFDNITVQYSTLNETVNTCATPEIRTSVTVPTPPPGWPTTGTFDLKGHFTTGLDPYPGTLNLVSEANAGAPKTAVDSVAWNNTVSSRADFWINGTSGGAFWEDTNYSLQDVASGGSFADAPSVITSLSMRLQSSNATVASTWYPQVDVGGVSIPSPAQSFSEGCSVGSVGSAPIWAGPGGGISTLSSNSATLTWDSTANGTGWVTLAEVGGTAVNVSAETLVDPNRTAYEYVVEAHGLAGWALYGLTFNVETDSACRTPGGGTMAAIHVMTALHGPWLQMPGDPVMVEQDAPYDSVTHQGGGATLAWQVPASFLERAGTSFLNGTILLTSTNASINATLIPLQAPLTPFTNYSIFGSRLEYTSADTFAVNLTGLDPNNPYTARIELNYSTTTEPLMVGTNSISFWYEKDTSGDGLTDWEKSYGWEVTYQSLSGWVREHVQADPYRFATNGLVGDFVEKEYGLNPSTVDTAGSHMLDTWNLTFNLQPGARKLPTGSNFRVWFENSTYHPFATTVSYTPGKYESGGPVGNGNQTNISASASGGITSGDGAPWAARALWSYAALETFVNLSGVRNAGWLRAVEGSYDGIPTLTVEGKLSWGANPLATSTPNDGIADGARVNPLYDVGLEFHSVDANQSSLNQSVGYAVEMHDNYTSDAGRAVALANYSTEGIVGNPTQSTVDNYVTTLPATQTAPIQTVSLEVIANTKAGLAALPINGSGQMVSVRYDLVSGAPVVVSVTGSGGSGSSSLFGVFQEVPMGTKAPTWLWVPTDNGTINGLPLGLERYVGEQSFDLVVVNASSTISSMTIPVPWGPGSASMTLSPGLNDILVPREQFLDSPFGQAVFLGRNTSYNTSNGAPPLLGSSEQGVLAEFHGANLMVDLGAYWQNRSIGSGPGNLSQYETGVPGGNALEVQVMAASSATSNNTGGLASDPGLYATVGAPPAVQSIVTLNLTNTTMLDLLLAALIDNTSGGPQGVNGTLQSITYQVGFLGLDQVVVNAIANGTEPSDGLYGAPTSHFSSPPPASAWGVFWNAVTSFVTNPLGTVMSLVATVWNAATAAFTYLNHLAHEAAAIGAKVVARVAGAIILVGDLIVQALEQLLLFLKGVIIALLQPIVTPMETELSSFASGVSSSIDLAWSQENSSGAVTSSVVDQFWGDMSGSVFIAALGVGIAIEIALTLATPFDIGASFVIPILATLVSAGLASYPGLPQITVFGPSAFESLRTFLVDLDSVPAIFVNPELYEALGVLAVGTSTIASLLAVSMLKDTVSSIRTNGAGAAVFAGILAAAAFLALSLDVYGFFHDSPGLIILGLFLSLLGASVAGVLVAKGASEIYGPSLADYLVAILYSGGFSAGFDVGKLVTE